MKRHLRFAVALLSMIAAPVAVAHAADPALEGMYTAQGVNPDGSEYQAVVRIVNKGESFHVAWMFPEVVDEGIVLVLKSAGVGITGGGMLAVSYYGQDATGVVLYQIENGGERLTGRRAGANGGAVFSETLIRLPAPAPAPAAVPDSGQPRPPASKTPPRAVRRAIVVSR